MTRRSIYSSGLLLTLACTVMTIASISIPRWISFSPDNEAPRTISRGLHKQCSTVTGTCVAYPTRSTCSAGNENFCHLWRTVGFLLSLSVVVELVTLASFAVIIAGGVQRRVAGWHVISLLLIFSGVVQCTGMAIITSLFNNNDRFFSGWYLDLSWCLATASWSILILTAAGTTASAFVLPAEGDYELIPDHPMSYEQDEQLRSRVGLWNQGHPGDGERYEHEREQSLGPK